MIRGWRERRRFRREMAREIKRVKPIVEQAEADVVEELVVTSEVFELQPGKTPICWRGHGPLVPVRSPWSPEVYWGCPHDPPCPSQAEMTPTDRERHWGTLDRARRWRTLI